MTNTYCSAGRLVETRDARGAATSVSRSGIVLTILVVALVLGLGRVAHAGEAGDALIAFSTGRWGYLQPDGHIAIEPRFDDARSFSEGLGAVKVGSSWGFIGRTGAVVVPPGFLEVGDFHEGVARARAEEGWGIVDRRGRWVAESRYAGLSDCSHGVLIATLKGRRCEVLVGSDGREIVPAVEVPAEQVLTLVGGRCLRSIWGLPGFECDDYRMDLLSLDGTALVREVPRWFGLQKTRRRTVLTTDGLVATVSDHNGSGLLSVDTGTWLIPQRRGRGLGWPSEGLVSFVPELDGKERLQGYMAYDGTVRITPRYSWVSRFEHGLAQAEDRDGSRIIDTSGRTVIGFPGAEVRARWWDQGLVVVWNNAPPPERRYSCFTRAGRPVGHRGSFEWIDPPHDGRYRAASGGRIGYLDGDGTWSVPPVWEVASPFESERAVVESDGVARLISTEGSVVTTWALDAAQLEGWRGEMLKRWPPVLQ